MRFNAESFPAFTKCGTFFLVRLLRSSWCANPYKPCIKNPIQRPSSRHARAVENNRNAVPKLIRCGKPDTQNTWGLHAPNPKMDSLTASLICAIAHAGVQGYSASLRPATRRLRRPLHRLRFAPLSIRPKAQSALGGRPPYRNRGQGSGSAWSVW